MRRVVEHCENWIEMNIVRGRHCFNCANRNGFTFRAQPDMNCKNFKLNKDRNKIYGDNAVCPVNLKTV